MYVSSFLFPCWSYILLHSSSFHRRWVTPFSISLVFLNLWSVVVMVVRSTFLCNSILLQFLALLWIPNGSLTAELFPIMYSFSRMCFPVWAYCIHHFGFAFTHVATYRYGGMETLIIHWKPVSSLPPTTLLLSKKFLKRRKLYSSSQTPSFNPTILFCSQL